MGEYKEVKKNNHIILLLILIILFCITLYISIQYIAKYHNLKSPSENELIMEIKTKDATVTLVNNGLIEEKISEDTFLNENEKIIENINIIELISKDKNKKNIKFNVKYNIEKNDFKENLVPNNNSEVLVRFSYSFDNKNWTYINNVISSDSSNISPLIGNHYDIAGLVTNLKVATNFELSLNKGNSKMFWRSETIFKKLQNDNLNKELKAQFIIEYNTN